MDKVKLVNCVCKRLEKLFADAGLSRFGHVKYVSRDGGPTRRDVDPFDDPNRMYQIILVPGSWVAGTDEIASVVTDGRFSTVFCAAVPGDWQDRVDATTVEIGSILARYGAEFHSDIRTEHKFGMVRVEVWLRVDFNAGHFSDHGARLARVKVRK